MLGDYLSLATMFLQSNDLFVSTAPGGIAQYESIKRPISGDITSSFKLWDAGTQISQQPGVGDNQKPRLRME